MDNHHNTTTLTSPLLELNPAIFSEVVLENIQECIFIFKKQSKGVRPNELFMSPYTQRKILEQYHIKYATPVFRDKPKIFGLELIVDFELKEDYFIMITRSEYTGAIMRMLVSMCYQGNDSISLTPSQVIREDVNQLRGNKHDYLVTDEAKILHVN